MGMTFVARQPVDIKFYSDSPNQSLRPRMAWLLLGSYEANVVHLKAEGLCAFKWWTELPDPRTEGKPKTT